MNGTKNCEECSKEKSGRLPNLDKESQSTYSTKYSVQKEFKQLQVLELASPESTESSSEEKTKQTQNLNGIESYKNTSDLISTNIKKKSLENSNENEPKTSKTLEKESKNSKKIISELISSAPSTPRIGSARIEHHNAERSSINSKRSKTCLDSKYRCAITSERLAQLRKTVENAARDHKIFMIKGGWSVIRRELLKRDWIEKIEQHSTSKQHRYTNMDDVTSNLPAKQDWESPSSYVEKCEKTVMSRMLSAYEVDLYWSMRKEPSDIAQRNNPYKLINRFSRSLFSSKEGLALLLQQAYWYSEENISQINFPRCYVLGFPDHYNLFVDDFRITSCMGLMKWFVERYEQQKHFQSLEGTVPHSTLTFALERCAEYVAGQRHADIDKEFNRIWDHEWEQFFTQYDAILHKGELFEDFKESLPTKYAQIKLGLKEIIKHWPQYDIDGQKNIWIMKPGNKCRGRGITLIKNIADVDKIMSLKLKYVVQKYIERPLTIYNTKFDIRQWFMVTNVQPLTIWMWRDSYLRFSGQIFNLENFHESLHLTNYAIQCKYDVEGLRNKALPQDNMWDSQSFKAYLSKIGKLDKWDKVIYPGMKESIVCAMLASQDTMDRRPNTYEIYGADFMLSEDFRPWLLEINCSPDLSLSTSVTSRLCPACMEDVIKVMVDRRRDPNADTGLFDMVYKQNYPRTPPYLGMNLAVRGRKIFRSRIKSTKSNENKEVKDRSNALAKPKKIPDFAPSYRLADIVPSKTLTTVISPDFYKGPVIEDLIEELQKSVCENLTGIDFAQPQPKQPVEIKKKPLNLGRADRVHKFRMCRQKTTNKQSSLSRKPNGNENTKDRSKSTNSIEKNSSRTSRQSSRSYFGVFREWASKHNVENTSENQKYDLNWENSTASILKGETFKSSSSKRNICSLDLNKNCNKNTACLNTLTFDLNKLLPQINSSNEK